MGLRYYAAKLSLMILLAIVFASGLFRVTNAAFNEKINYQGKLTDSSNVAVADGAYDVVFKLYTAAGGGSAIWTESWTNAALFTDSATTFTNDGCAVGIDKMAYTSDTNEGALAAGQYLWNTTKKESAVIESISTTGVGGYVCFYDPASTWVSADTITNRIYMKSGLFSVMLGGVSSLSAINLNQTLYLGVTVGADSEMKPRKMIGAVSAAFEAKQLGGKTWAAPDAIGSGTPAAGSFTTLSAAGLTSISGGAISLNASSNFNIDIGTGTSTGVITIGNATVSNLALNDAQWSVTEAGAATFASISTGSGAIGGGAGSFTTLTSSGNSTLATGSSTTNTFGSGASSVNTIGSVTTPGTLTLHGATVLDNTFTVSGSNLTSLGGNLTVTGTAWTATPTISGLITATSGFDSNAASTVAGLTVDGNGNLAVSNGTLAVTAPSTTGNAGSIVANSLTTGSGLDITSTSTAGGASGVSKLLNLSRSGVNANTAHTAYGLYSSVTNTNATSGTNIAGYFSASGATTANYGLVVANGNVGIGTTSPEVLLDVSKSQNTGTSIKVTNSNTGAAAYSSIRIVEDVNSDKTFDLFHLNTNYTTSGILIPNSSFVDALDSGGLILSARNASGVIKFATGGLAASNERIRIDSSGNVGIGDTSPAALLTVGNGDLFQVNSSGQITAVAGYTQGSGNFSISGTGTFGTGTGAISLNGDITIAANKSLTMTAGTGAFSIAGYSGTGNATSITSSSTTDLNKVLNISQTGATTGTDYGLYVANTGAGTTNIGGYFSASGATNNYAIDARGNVIIGDGTAYGDSRLVIAGTDGNNDAAIVAVKRDGTTNPVFSVLPFDDSVFISAGVYYNNGAWVHNSNDTNSQILSMSPVNGMYLFASSNSSVSWNVASAVNLWDAAGVWKNTVQSTATGNSYFTGGNVGIGDTTPDGKLDIEPTGAVTTASYGINLSNLTTNVTTNGINKYGAYITSTGSFTGSTGTATNNYGLYVDTVSGADNNYGAYVADSMGIGTAAPEGKLHVYSGSAGAVTASGNANQLVLENSGTGGISILTPNNAYGAIYFGDGDSNLEGSVQYYHQDNQLQFWTSYITDSHTTAAMVMTNTGKIGINDMTPDGWLDIEPTGATTAASYGINLNNIATNAATDAINKYGAYITSTGTFTGGAGVATNNYGLYVDTVSGADNNYGAYIAGNTGIGTSGPESKLQVSGGGLCVGSDANCNTDNNTEGVVYSSSTAMTAYDVAENYPTKDSTLLPAEVVSLDNSQSGPFVGRGKIGETILGVVSTAPAVLMGGFNGQEYKEEHQVAVALSGRVPVKVSLENGPIKAGDYLTASSVPGIAMKADKVGRVIGTAMGNFDGSGENKVVVFVNPHWYGGSLAENGNLINSNNEMVVSSFGQDQGFIDLVKVTVKEALATLSGTVRAAGEWTFDKLTTKQICVEDVCINRDQLKEMMDNNKLPADLIVTPTDLPNNPVEPSPSALPSTSPEASPNLIATPTPTPTPTPEENVNIQSAP